MVSADFEIARSQKPMRYDFQRKQSGLNHACLVHSPPNPHTHKHKFQASFSRAGSRPRSATYISGRQQVAGWEDGSDVPL
jgi:hypothetical protein